MVAVKEGMFPVPEAVSPTVVFEFVQAYVMSAIVLLFSVSLTVVLWQGVRSEMGFIVGTGSTEMV
ncbi:hypothetical protein D3C72_2506440 [compost metagenome]